MAVKIRLQRFGAKKNPQYRVCVANSFAPRDGKCLEYVGIYHPLLQKTDPKRIVLKLERIEWWLKNGAKPTATVSSLIKKQKNNTQQEAASSGA